MKLGAFRRNQKSFFTLYERIKIKLRQAAFQKRNNAPFLSGDSFASLCGLVINSEADLDFLAKLSIPPVAVFCRSEFVQKLAVNIKWQGQSKVLFAGNSDLEFTDIKQIPTGKFKKIFLQNSFISDNQHIFTLPIGVENLKLGINGLPKNLRDSRDWENRSRKVMVGPFSPTHPERSDLLEFASSNLDTFEISNEPLKPMQFSIAMRRYKFVACPRGNGIDTHRFWEVLYRGGVPIVKKSNWSQSLSYLKIPFIEVGSWKDCELSIKEFEEQNRFEPPESVRLLWLHNWKDLILND